MEVDPPPRAELVVWLHLRGRRDLAHEHEVHVNALAPRDVLLVAEQAGRHAIERTAQAAKLAREPGFLAQLAAGGLEWSLARFELAADRQPGAQALVLD